MKKTIFALFLLLLAVSSCSKQDDNGDLGGNWQLLTWENKVDNTLVATNADGYYYTIHRQTLKLSKVGQGNFLLADFRHEGDALVIVKLYRAPLDSPETFAALAEYGGDESGRFLIRALSSDRLVLESSTSVLTFRKY